MNISQEDAKKITSMLVNDLKAFKQTQDVIADSIKSVMSDGTQKQPDAIQKETEGKREVSVNEAANTGYYEEPQSRESVTTDSILEQFGSTPVGVVKPVKPTESEVKAKKAAVLSENTNWDDTVSYKNSEYKNIDGKMVKYKLISKKMDWGSGFGDDPYTGLCRKITETIKEKYGGWGRIHSIVVRDQQLVINDVCYMPLLDNSVIETCNFPLDTVDYIRSGAIAQFFDWSTIREMESLYSLDFDDTGFFITTVADGVGLSRRIEADSLFRVNKSLMIIVIAGNILRRDERVTTSRKHIERDISTKRHFMNFSDGYKIDIYANTNGFQNYTFGNLKNYATNRGNKGLLRFTGGVFARAGIAAVGGVLNAGVHLVGGVFQMLKGSVTGVTENDITK